MPRPLCGPSSPNHRRTGAPGRAAGHRGPHFSEEPEQRQLLPFPLTSSVPVFGFFYCQRRLSAADSIGGCNTLEAGLDAPFRSRRMMPNGRGDDANPGNAGGCGPRVHADGCVAPCRPAGSRADAGDARRGSGGGYAPGLRGGARARDVRFSNSSTCSRWANRSNTRAGLSRSWTPTGAASTGSWPRGCRKRRAMPQVIRPAERHVVPSPTSGAPRHVAQVESFTARRPGRARKRGTGNRPVQ